MVQKLTVRAVLKANRKALEAGNLGAQLGGQDICLYDYSTRDHPAGRCAIGAALTKSTLKTIHEKQYNAGTSVLSLIKSGVLAEVNREDAAVLMLIQMSHDAWVKKSAVVGGVTQSHLPAELQVWRNKHEDRPMTKLKYVKFLDLVERIYS